MRRYMVAIVAGCMLASCGGGGSSEPAGNATEATATAPAPAAAPANQAPPAFAMCGSCHSVTPHETRIGPSLFGVFGRKSGTEPGYAYSDAMKNAGKTWDEPTLDKYLTDPRADVPGTKMTFAGFSDPERRKAVIDYLKTLK